jgi:hypothetical protein
MIMIYFIIKKSLKFQGFLFAFYMISEDVEYLHRCKRIEAGMTAALLLRSLLFQRHVRSAHIPYRNIFPVPFFKQGHIVAGIQRCVE